MEVGKVALLEQLRADQVLVVFASVLWWCRFYPLLQYPQPPHVLFGCTQAEEQSKELASIMALHAKQTDQYNKKVVYCNSARGVCRITMRDNTHY